MTWELWLLMGVLAVWFLVSLCVLAACMHAAWGDKQMRRWAADWEARARLRTRAEANAARKRTGGRP